MKMVESVLVVLVLVLVLMVYGRRVASAVATKEACNCGYVAGL